MKRIFRIILALLIVLLAVLLYNTVNFKSRQIASEHPLSPVNFKIDSSAIEHLSGAIRIQTISYDDSAFLSGNRAFDTMLAYLKSTYPAVFNTLQDTVINGKNLLLKWEGSDNSQLPCMLYAHMDVVPIEEATINQWKHAPFSGDVADGFIWGRGAIDDKGSLISIFEAVNRLVQAGFKPARTIYIASGSDEEIGGKNGAGSIVGYCRARHIHFQFYLDEGLMVTQGLVPDIQKDVALIGTAEKGYATYELSVKMEGGHSSSPAKETAIDVLNKAVENIHNHPFKEKLCKPLEEFLKYTGPEMPVAEKIVSANPWLFKKAIFWVYEKTGQGNAMVRTTAVTTVFNAGIKENVIPSYASAKVNFRILPGETCKQVEEKLIRIVNDPRVTIAPIEMQEASKIGSADAWGFKLLQQTCSEVFPEACVSPSLMIGATDSKHFEDIADEIYRFFPTRMNKESLSGFHGINEKIQVSNYMETIAFYTQLLKDMQDFKGTNQK